MAMEIIVVGCGRVGAELVTRLWRRGNRVSVVDHDAAAFAYLPPDFVGQTVEGDPLNQDVLERAGIKRAEALAAVLESDAENVVVGHIARSVYHVPNVVVRNYDPRWQTFHQVFGLQVVSPTIWGAQRIEELIYHNSLRTVFSAGNGEVEIYEFIVPPAWNGHRLTELLPEGQCVAAAVTRAGRALLPGCDTVLETGDVVNLSATLEGVQLLHARLVAAPEEV